MPIDFPTVKYGDPTVNPPSAPASTDLVQLRTAAGADRVAYLGNLAGIAPVTVANDQALVYTGGAWASYSLTAAGRAISGVAGTVNTFPYFSAANVVTLASITANGRSLVAATDAAAARTVIGAADDSNVVHRTGAESIAGEKTCSNAWRWNLGTTGSIQYTTPGGVPGILFRLGDPNTPDDNSYRSEIRGGNGRVDVIVNPVMGAGAGTAGFFISSTTLSPRVTNTISCGSTGFVWTQVYATNTTISTSDSRLKTEPRNLRDAEFKAASAIARLPAVWRWLNRVHGDENCEAEGKEARKHFGPTVQAAIAVMEGFGLDPFAYSFICYDEWEAEPEQWHEWPAKDAVLGDDGNVLEPAVEAGRELIQPAREAGDRYSFRKEELLCFIVRALAQEIDGLAERVTALEAKD